MNPEPVLRLTNATFGRYQGPVFQDINYEIQANEVWAVTGAPGAGKSTFAEVLAGKIPVRKGTLKINLNSEQDNLKIESKVCLVSFSPEASRLNYRNFYYQQRYHSTDSEDILTVQEYLITNQVSAEANLSWVTQLLQLEDLLPLAVIKLSSGQTRKMVLAKALLSPANILILDNPYIGLDAESRQNLNKIIKTIIAGGRHILLISPPNQIPDFITHVLVLKDFTIYQSLPYPEYLKNNNTDSFENPGGIIFKDLFSFKKEGLSFSTAVNFKNVNITYGEKKVLQNINWEIKKGEKWALIGPNGSGKTTLLSLIYGDNPQAFANKIILFDKWKGSGESIWDIKKRIGFVSPELHLYFRQAQTCLRVAATGFTDTLYLNRPLTTEETNQIRCFFKSLQAEHLLEKNFQHLSMGEQRLVLIIRSLIKNPALLLWDEPFQGLNSQVIQSLTQMLHAYAAPDKTVILISHYDQEIPPWIHKRLYLEAGKIAKVVES